MNYISLARGVANKAIPLAGVLIIAKIRGFKAQDCRGAWSNISPRSSGSDGLKPMDLKATLLPWNRSGDEKGHKQCPYFRPLLCMNSTFHGMPPVNGRARNDQGNVGIHQKGGWGYMISPGDGWGQRRGQRAQESKVGRFALHGGVDGAQGSTDLSEKSSSSTRKHDTSARGQ